MHGTVGKVNNVYMKGQIGLELLEYFFRGLFEHTHGPATVELTISGDLARPDVTGYVNIGSGKGGAAELVPRGLDGKLTLVVPSGRVDITPEAVSLTNVVVSTEKGKEARASGRVALDHWQPGAIQASIQGDISPRLFQWGLPEQVGDASGGIALDVRVGGVWRHPTWQGTATVKDLAVPRAQARRATSSSTAAPSRSTTSTSPSAARATAARGPAASRCAAPSTTTRGSIASMAASASATACRCATSTSGSTAATSPTGSRAGRSRSRRASSSSAAATGSTLKGNVDIVEGRYAQNFDLAGMIISPKRTSEASEPFWQGVPLLETMRLAMHWQSRVDALRQEQHRRAGADHRARRLGHAVRAAARRRDHDRGGRAHLGARLPLLVRHRSRPSPVRGAEEDPRRDADHRSDGATRPTPTTRSSRTRSSCTSPARCWRCVLDLTSTEGWTRAQVLQVLLLGQSPDEIRRITQGARDRRRRPCPAPAPPPTPSPRR